MADVVSATIIIRHGARAPNPNEMKAFADDSPCRLQWHHADGSPPDYETDHNLTEVGREQMRAVGRYLATRYGAVARRAKLEWHSSAVERCVESGSLVGAGLVEALGAGAWPAAPVTYEPDDVFRAWNLPDTPYKRMVAALPGTAEFGARAGAAQPALGAVLGKLGCVQAPEEQQLLWSTYVHLMAEVEHYAGGGALTRALSAEEVALVDEHARWVWERRFQGAADFAEAIGGRLWALAATPPPAPTLRVFSGHDYSVLCALARLGERGYPPPALGPGCHLLVEHRADGSARVLLNAAPFRGAGGEASATITEHSLSPVAQVGVDGAVQLVR